MVRKMRKEIQGIIKRALTQQAGAYNRGHENSGASIDVLAEIRRLLSVQSLSRNKKAQEVLTEIAAFDTLNNEAIKFAKHLSYQTRLVIKQDLKAVIR
ncbi:hypothetical protein [Citrobacter phage Ci1]|nr:hypothetical protein [Citrobacter phage Ci1]